MPSDPSTKWHLGRAVVVDPHVAQHYASVLPKMLDFYRTEGHRLSDPELLIALDVRFIKDLIPAVCEPLGFFEGACVFIGAVLLRQHDPVCP